MKAISQMRKEDGYTLLETVVAMALFVGALIPLGVTLGNFMFDGSANQIRLALTLAESEMSRVAANRNFVDGSTSDERGMTVRTRVHGDGNRIEVNVAVVSTKHPEKTLVVLNKTFLVYQ